MRTLTFIGCLMLLLFLLMFISIVSSAPSYEHVALQAADQCDWIGSGGGGRGVRPVYLRCSRGTILWRYPRGALRIVLSPPVLAGLVSKVNYELNQGKDNVYTRNDTHSSGNDGPFRLSGFRTCTKISGPIRVYLETRGKLRSIYSPRDGKDVASHRCFHAKKQPAALYIEAEEFVSGEHDARLQYDLELRYIDSRQGLSRRFNDEEEDCRPCSMDELAKAYCQSDFIARGTVSAVQRQPNLDAAELVLRVTKILRRIEENEVTESNNDADTTDSHDRRNVRVRVPTACDARHGQGEFVIMAKRRLGDLILVCAPRIETWAKAVRELETAPCVLQS